MSAIAKVQPMRANTFQTGDIAKVTTGFLAGVIVRVIASKGYGGVVTVELMEDSQKEKAWVKGSIVTVASYELVKHFRHRVWEELPWF